MHSCVCTVSHIHTIIDTVLPWYCTAVQGTQGGKEYCTTLNSKKVHARSPPWRVPSRARPGPVVAQLGNGRAASCASTGRLVRQPLRSTSSSSTAASTVNKLEAENNGGKGGAWMLSPPRSLRLPPSPRPTGWPSRGRTNQRGSYHRSPSREPTSPSPVCSPRSSARSRTATRSSCCAATARLAALPMR